MAAELYAFAILSQIHSQYKSELQSNTELINDTALIHNKYINTSIEQPIWVDTIKLFSVFNALNENLEITITRKNIEDLVKRYEESDFYLYKKIRDDVDIIIIDLENLLVSENDNTQISIKKYKKLFQVDKNIEAILINHLN